MILDTNSILISQNSQSLNSQESGMPQLLQRPVSATHGIVAAVGLGAFLLTLVIIRVAHPFSNNVVYSALLVMGVTGGTIFPVDLIWLHVHLRPSTGMDSNHNDPSWQRTVHKFVGLLGSLGFVAALYWIFPEYHGSFYEHYYSMLRFVLPIWLLLALPYFYFIDRRMPKPLDGYWHMGQLVAFHWHRVDYRELKQHVTSWLIKGFFLPLMFTYMCNDLGKFIAFDFVQLTSFHIWYDFLYDSFYFIDVGLVSMGYLMSLRLTDTHIRSAEPTMLGWAVALVCYDPFWSLIGRQYLSYQAGNTWGDWLGNSPVCYGLWGSTILVLTAIYVWATVSFGVRFSNLTHRGIITNGPYRWTKHPAYVAKNLSWWMISIPFLAEGSAFEALRRCLLLLVLNGIYILRAKTEERHLSRDPMYECYSQWIDKNGIFRCIRQLPFIRRIAY